MSQGCFKIDHTTTNHKLSYVLKMIIQKCISTCVYKEAKTKWTITTRKHKFNEEN